MNIRARITVDFPKERIAASLRRSMARSINAAAVDMQRTMRVVLGENKSPSMAGLAPGASTGELRRSIKVYPYATPSSLAATTGTSVLHGLFQQKGIRARSHLLTIPLTKKAAQLRRGVTSLRTVPGLVFVPSRSGGGLLGTRSKRGIFQPMFRLKEYVAPRPWLNISTARGIDSARRAGAAAFSRAWKQESDAMARSLKK